MRLSCLVLFPIFVLMALYRSLSSDTFDVSNTIETPDVSEAVTFLSFTSTPTAPRVSVSAISFEKAMLTVQPVTVMEPLLRVGSSMKERMIVGALESEVNEVSRGGGDSQEQVI